jgi:hypothetical protein
VAEHASAQLEQRRNVVATELAHEKKLEQRVVYRLTVTDEDNPQKDAKKRGIWCTYHNGARIHGKGTGTHPPIVISAKDQDEVLWAGSVPFRIAFEVHLGNGPSNPFYRTDWNALMGNDGVYRVATGPANPTLIGKSSVEYKYTVTRQLKESGADDPDSEPLDPHFIIDP